MADSTPTTTTTAPAPVPGQTPRRSSRISSKPKPEFVPSRRQKRGGKAGSATNTTTTTTGGRSTSKQGNKRGADEIDADDERGDGGVKEGKGDVVSGEEGGGDAKKAKLPPPDEDTVKPAETSTLDAANSQENQSPDPSTQPVQAVEGDGDVPMTDSAPAASSSAAPPAAAAKTTVDIGDALPSLVVKNEKGEDVETSTLVVEKGVVLFLVPRADTPGCTQQACGFRDIWQEFTTLDYDVYCLSADTPTAQSKWQTKKQLPYQLLSDPKRVLIGALGAGEGNKTKRSHFVFEKGGKLIDKKMPVKPVESPRLALEAIKRAKA
ncbi:thioredoxin-like protein [Pisolithus albus]|nr:thioredoxin-like protein [Pisolithus albus]